MSSRKLSAANDKIIRTLTVTDEDGAFPYGTYRALLKCEVYDVGDIPTRSPEQQFSIGRVESSVNMLTVATETDEGYFYTDVVFTKEEIGNTVYVGIKQDATVGSTDYAVLEHMLLVPITSPSGRFPRDVARRALVETVDTQTRVTSPQ